MKMAALMRCVVLVLVLCFCAEVSNAQTCTATDSSALQYFYREFVYARTEFETWDPTTNCCGWEGVTCDGSGNVITLLIENAKQVQPYPNGLFYLIGTGLLGLKSLTSLTMKNVAFNGGIPASWGTGLSGLQVINLDGCNVVGALPDTLCNLKAITTFSCPNNLLNGPLPACYQTPYTTFPNLKVWNITGNNFS